MGSEMIDFGFEKVEPSLIMVVGIGGGGSNAVNHMHELGISKVKFMVCNTDKQALERSNVNLKQHLGKQLTQGLGAGNNPERGKNAAIENLDDIVASFKTEGTRMVFITAGMGGGTGTGAAPIIAKAAKENGILTVAIVTMPFINEGKKRTEFAKMGIAELRKNVDALLVIHNEKIREIYGELPLMNAFGKADDILAQAAKGVSEIITGNGIVNVDFADVNTTMKDSGVCLMGTARAEGDDRAIEAARLSMSSPLLDNNHITGAQEILLNMTYGDKQLTTNEHDTILNYIQELSNGEANIIWGAVHDEDLGDKIELTVVATRFNKETNDSILGIDYQDNNPIFEEKKKDVENSENTSEDAPTPFASRERLNVAKKKEDDAQNSQILKIEINPMLMTKIDNILSKPGFIRRGIKFKEVKKGGTVIRLINEEQQKTSEEPKEVFLFDIKN